MKRFYYKSYRWPPLAAFATFSDSASDLKDKEEFLKQQTGLYHLAYEILSYIRSDVLLTLFGLCILTGQCIEFQSYLKKAYDEPASPPGTIDFFLPLAKPYITISGVR